MFCLFKLCICLIVMVVEVQPKSYKQVYISNTNFNNPERWSGTEHGVPCAGDRIEFQPNQVVSVYVQTNATITEMYLPVDGEFIFGDGVMWGGSEDLSSCEEEDHDGHVISYNSYLDNWFNPNNWKAYELNDGSEKMSMDLIDAEKVPCDYDQVTFPSQNSWTVGISSDFKIMSLNVWEKSYDSASFASYRTSDSGRYQFQGDGVVNVQSATCSDPTGCVCRSSPEVQAEICAQILCDKAKCSSPVNAAGQCCGTCGAMLSMSYGAGYTEAAMQKEIDRLKTDSKYSGVHTALSKVTSAMNVQKQTVNFEMKTNPALFADDDYIQITIQDENTGTELGKTAQQFGKELLDSLSAGSNDFGVDDVKLASSGDGIASPQGGLGPGGVAGIVIGVILLLAVIIVVFIVVSRRPGMKYSIFKSNKEAENVSNPLYDMPKVHKEELSGVDAVEEVDRQYGSKDSSVTGLPNANVMTSDFGMSFGNPMYDEEDV